MEEILQVIARLNALINQLDGTDNALAELEMQREGVFRMGAVEIDLNAIKADMTKNIKIVTAQKDAAIRAIKDISGLSSQELRDRLSEISAVMTRVSEIALEERRLRATFEILALGDSFGTEPGDTRADFEEQLSTAKKVKENGVNYLIKVVNATINKSPLGGGASDSVIQRLHTSNLGENHGIITSG